MLLVSLKEQPVAVHTSTNKMYSVKGLRLGTVKVPGSVEEVRRMVFKKTV